MQWCMYEPEVKDDFWFLEVPSNVGPLIWGPLLNRNVFLHLGQVTSKTPLLRGSRILQLHCVHWSIWYSIYDNTPFLNLPTAFPMLLKNPKKGIKLIVKVLVSRFVSTLNKTNISLSDWRFQFLLTINNITVFRIICQIKRGHPDLDILRRWKPPRRECGVRAFWAFGPKPRRKAEFSSAAQGKTGGPRGTSPAGRKPGYEDMGAELRAKLGK